MLLVCKVLTSQLRTLISYQACLLNLNSSPLRPYCAQAHCSFMSHDLHCQADLMSLVTIVIHLPSDWFAVLVCPHRAGEVHRLEHARMFNANRCIQAKTHHTMLTMALTNWLSYHTLGIKFCTLSGYTAEHADAIHSLSSTSPKLCQYPIGTFATVGNHPGGVVTWNNHPGWGSHSGWVITQGETDIQVG